MEQCVQSVPITQIKKSAVASIVIIEYISKN